MTAALRVLHFYKTALPDTKGGVEQFVDQLARSCESSNINSTVLALSQQKHHRPIVFNGYQLHRIKCRLAIASTPLSFSAITRFAKLANTADIIHYHFPWPLMDLVHFICRINKPSVVTYHSDIVRQQKLLTLYKPLMHRFLNNVSRIVTTSPNYLNSSSVLQQYAEKVSVIPIGLDQSTYPIPSAAQLESWKKTIGERFFLFIGELRYYKGLPILLQAAYNTPFPIVIAGDGQTMNDLKKQAQQLGLKKVHFLGRVSDQDKVALLMLSYAVVFPSHLRSEAFGITLLEGAMYGKPMISCEIGTGTSYVNQHNETGFVIPPNNPLRLRHAMQQLWNNPKQAAQMGQQAMARYQGFFTAELQRDAYLKLYQQLV